jgi:hypothetical protein
MKINVLDPGTCQLDDVEGGTVKNVTSAFFGGRGLFEAKRQQ